jgi:hypothetical protein
VVCPFRLRGSLLSSFLIQLLLPAKRKNGSTNDTLHAKVNATLTERFGGVTAYERVPASGLWKRPDGGVEGDDVIMVEVEAEALDRRWWSSFRQEMERKFKQQKILVRAIRIDSL